MREALGRYMETEQLADRPRAKAHVWLTGEPKA